LLPPRDCYKLADIIRYRTVILSAFVPDHHFSAQISRSTSNCA
jgi:hypothetical protein